MSVHNLPAHTRMSVSEALEYATRVPLSEVIVVGHDEEGDVFAVSSAMTRKDSLWLSEQLRLHALNI